MFDYLFEFEIKLKTFILRSFERIAFYIARCPDSLQVIVL